MTAGFDNDPHRINRQATFTDVYRRTDFSFPDPDLLLE